MLRFGIKYIIIILIMVRFLISDVATYMNMAELIDHGQETIAVVTERRYVRHSISKYSVKYMVNGVAYKNHLNLQYKNTFIGEEVIIYYNPNNPNKITPKDRDRATDSPVRLIVRLIVRCAAIAVGIFLFVWSGVKKARRIQRSEDLRTV